MRILDKIHSGAFVPREKFNEAVELINWLLRNAIVGVAPPLEVRVLPQGRGAGLAADSETCSDDEPVTLSVTPNTLDEDSWDRDEDKTGITVKYITKFRYDPTTRKLQVAYRTETKDSCGRAISISDEPAWVDVTTAELCD